MSTCLMIFDLTGVNDVYTWGDNSNYTLGQENEQKRKTAECVELFRRKQLSIKQVWSVYV